MAFGPQFRNTTCVNRVCVPTVPSETGGSTSTGGRGGTGGSGGKVGSGGNGGGVPTEGGAGGDVGTGGTEDTGGTVGTGGMGTGGTPPECTTNTNCIEANLDQPYVCRDGKCIELITPECPVLLPSNGALTVLKDTVPPIVLGGFASMTNPGDRKDTKAVINWDLAFNEFDSALGVGFGRPRTVGLICQGAAALLDMETEMTHLTQDVGVTGIVSTLSSSDLAAAWDFTQSPAYEAAKLRPVFFMSTGSADLRLANLDDNGLVWHLLGDPRVLSATTVALVQRIEPRVNALRASYFAAHSTDPGVEDPSVVPLRVTLVYNDDPTMTDVASVLVTPDATRTDTALTFNGKPVFDSVNQNNYHQVKVESVKYHSSPPPVTTNGVLELQQRPPHIIIGMATGEFGGMMSAVEANWGKAGTASLGLPRPFYVLSHFILSAATDIQAPMAVYAGTTPPINERSVGVAYALAQDDHSKALYNAYLINLKNSYNGSLDVAGSENHYDGAYSLLYSTMGAAPFSMNDPDGDDINSAWQDHVIARTGGTSVDVGQAKVADTVGKLSSSAFKMSLWGTMGAPAFDRVSGTRTSATSAWCMKLKSGSTSVWEAQIDGLIYDPDKFVFNAPAAPATVPTCLQQY